MQTGPLLPTNPPTPEIGLTWIFLYHHCCQQGHYSHHCHAGAAIPLIFTTSSPLSSFIIKSNSSITCHEIVIFVEKVQRSSWLSNAPFILNLFIYYYLLFSVDIYSVSMTRKMCYFTQWWRLKWTSGIVTYFCSTLASSKDNQLHLLIFFCWCFKYSHTLEILFAASQTLMYMQ